MKVFIIGGTGLLGSEAARELISRGHQVSSVALPPLPEGAPIPTEMELTFGNYLEMGDDEIRKLMEGCDGFIFAAGVDERVEGPPPIYSLYEKYNINPVRKLLTIAKECGVKHNVILGSYFAYFARKWPEMELTKHHPYIRSRVEQANTALSFADDNFDVAVLELPYIFGAQPGRKPVWTILLDRITKFKWTLYPKGGTTMVTVRQVAQCIAGALERNRGGKNYPVGYYNMTWVEMLTIFHKYMGMPNRKIITVPTPLVKIGMKSEIKALAEKGLEGGLDYIALCDIMASNCFINKKTIVEELGVTPDDIDAAIGESIKLCMEAYKGTANLLDMKGE